MGPAPIHPSLWRDFQAFQTKGVLLRSRPDVVRRTLVMVLGFASAVFAASCKPDRVAPPRKQGGPGPNHARLVGVSLDRFEADRLRTRTRLANADVDRRTGAVKGDGAIVEVRADDDPAHVRATVTAPAARADLPKRRFTLEGGVRLVDDAGRVMTTERVDYDARSDRLVSEGAVSIEGDNFVVDAAKLEARPRGGTTTLEGPVRSVIAPRDAP